MSQNRPGLPSYESKAAIKSLGKPGDEAIYTSELARYASLTSSPACTDDTQDSTVTLCHADVSGKYPEVPEFWGNYVHAQTSESRL